MIFFTDKTTATNAMMATMDNVAINGNSGAVGVGDGVEDGEDEDVDVGVGDVDDEEELAVASTVPLTSV